jgi:anaerobic ribonucleoside-triphosphate reductase activating protein
VNKDTLHIYMRHPMTKVLGPGNRYALWVQGCPLQCPGCLVPNSHSKTDGEEIEISILAEEILINSSLEGITISGGEPFLQAENLSKLIHQLKLKRDLGVIVYTGYILSEITQKIAKDPLSKWTTFYQQIDLLIDGRYNENLNDNGSLRGSANQKVIPLTDRYFESLHLYGNMEVGRKIEVSWKSDELSIVGVPSKELLTSLQSHGYLSLMNHSAHR